MRYLHITFKAEKDRVVQVDINKPARVLLIDKKNFKKYRATGGFTYYGGPCEKPPRMFRVPQKGEWTIVVEKGGYFKKEDITASVQLLPVGTPITDQGSSKPVRKPVSKIGQQLDAILDQEDDQELEAEELVEETEEGQTE